MQIPPHEHAHGRWKSRLYKKTQNPNCQFFSFLDRMTSCLKRKLHALAEETEQEDDTSEEVSLADTLSALGLKHGLITKVLAHLDELDDDGFEELTEFQNKHWVHFCPKTKLGQKPSNRAANQQRLHAQFCALLEGQIEQFLKSEDCTMDQFFTAVRAELRQIKEQQKELSEAFSFSSDSAIQESPTKRRRGAHNDGRRRRRRIDKLFENEATEGAMALITFVDEASDFTSFVESMEEHAQSMLRLIGSNNEDKAGGVKKCTWCSRCPCFDPWHRLEKVEHVNRIHNTSAVKVEIEMVEMASQPPMQQHATV
jgi:hypothetical protein